MLADIAVWTGLAVGAAIAGGGVWLWARRRLAAVERDLARRAAEAAAAASHRDRLLQTEEALKRELAQREARLAERRAEAESWRALLEALPVPVWRRGGDLALDWVNATYAAMVETDAVRAVDRSIELASPLAPDQPRKLAEKARDDGGRATETRRFVVAGDRRAYAVTETPLGDGRLAGYGADVTDVEELRTELRRHDEAHAEVLQSLSTAISIYAPDKRLIFHNRAFARLWRLEDDFLAARPLYGEVLEQLRETRQLPEVVDWQAWRRQRINLFTSALEPREELLHLPDGRTFRTTITPHPFGGLLIAEQDVTDQLVLERARNTLIAVQRATLDNLYEAVAVFGGDGRLRLSNRAFVSMWRLPEELLATTPHVAQVIDAGRALIDDGGNWTAVRDDLLEMATERQARRGRLERNDGVVLEFASVPLPDGAMLLTFLDVTDGVRIERALRERNDALQAADRMKSEFLANVSYELRTPLNTIIGFAEILANQYFGQLTDRQLEYSQGIIDSSHQLLILINDILDLASIEAGQMVLDRERFDLHATLENLLGLVRERARRRSLTLTFDCPADIGFIEADESRIKQVLFNLISNAIKFTPAGGAITVGATRTAEEVRLFVRDTGIGIPPEEQERVFEKFARSRAALALGERGVGLGLSLVRSFIELHGGQVELHSAPDKGTEIVCRLPVRAADTAEAPRPEAA